MLIKSFKPTLLYFVIVMSLFMAVAFLDGLAKNATVCHVASPDMAQTITAPATRYDEASEGAVCTGVCEELAAYIEDTLREWNKGPMAGKATRYHEIARDIAVVVLREPRIWVGSNGSREGVLLVSIAWWETRLRDYVDDGSCNRWMLDAWRRCGGRLSCLPKEALDAMNTGGTCDGGNAASLWQIHSGDGDIARHLTTKDLYSNRKLAAATALAIARRSIQAGAGLMQYVGGVGPDRAEKARQRLSKAEEWSRKHPFTLK